MRHIFLVLIFAFPFSAQADIRDFLDSCWVGKAQIWPYLQDQEECAEFRLGIRFEGDRMIKTLDVDCEGTTFSPLWETKNYLLKDKEIWKEDGREPALVGWLEQNGYYIEESLNMQTWMEWKIEWLEEGQKLKFVEKFTQGTRRDLWVVEAHLEKRDRELCENKKASVFPLRPWVTKW